MTDLSSENWSLVTYKPSLRLHTHLLIQAAYRSIFALRTRSAPDFRSDSRRMIDSVQSTVSYLPLGSGFPYCPTE